MIEFFKVVRTALGTATRVLVANLRGVGTEGSDNDAEPVDDAEVIHPLGFASRPHLTASTEAVAVRVGDEVIVLAVVDKSSTAFSSLAEGDTWVWSAKEPGNVIKLLATGALQVISKAGQTIQLMGAGATANKPVAHEGSATTGHTHAAGTLTAGPYPVVGVTASSTDTVAVGAGSANVLVPDT